MNRDELVAAASREAAEVILFSTIEDKNGIRRASNDIAKRIVRLTEDAVITDVQSYSHTSAAAHRDYADRFAAFRQAVVKEQEKQWAIMARNRDGQDELARQDYMIAAAEAHALGKVLDMLNGVSDESSEELPAFKGTWADVQKRLDGAVSE